MTTVTDASLMNHFSTITAPRVNRRKRHELADIIARAILAVICGADSWSEIELFGSQNRSDPGGCGRCLTAFHRMTPLGGCLHASTRSNSGRVSNPGSSQGQRQVERNHRYSCPVAIAGRHRMHCHPGRHGLPEGYCPGDCRQRQRLCLGRQGKTLRLLFGPN